MDSEATLILAEGAGAPAARRSSSWGLPPDLLSEAVRRLRVLALVYALAYFVEGLLPALLVPEDRAKLFGDPARLLLPAVLSIGGALAVAAIASRPGLSTRVKVWIGLAFEVLGSVGIAAVEYFGVPEGYRGLSWVAAWVLLFGVVIPTPPRIACTSAVVSLSTVPLVYAAGMARGVNAPLDPIEFFFSLVLPYVVVALMVYVGSRVVNQLGSAVRKAREMGSYRLVEPLGKGGMGEVWRAQHRMLARPAAIKLIRPEVLGATAAESRYMLQRFEREAQATALMRSAHTLELYDFGVADDGTFYYVMELLDGFDLEELVERFGPVPPERALYFLEQICESLAEAHEAGLIHRDIKPANLYVCRYGRQVDFIKVLDFGLVKHGGVSDDGPDDLTGERLAAGTPAFMSPEQAMGGADVDGRSDLYSVGCVAYWLLTGAPVFKGRTAVETMMMHVQRRPEPPSRGSEYPVPPDLDGIVLACLAKEPEARPQTADELAAQLARVRTDGEWTAAHAGEWWDSHRPGRREGRASPRTFIQTRRKQLA
ncbi:MAG TPA: serine/threonine-protein kinase [Gemmatimonadales bacterium]|nr:serine/threonine-protein kinase [Gemmatimonadales bacterium]